MGGNIVLGMITKDSYYKVGENFIKVLNSSLIVPYTDMIIVDDSKDNSTSKILKEFANKNNKNIIFLKSEDSSILQPNRAIARETLFRYVKRAHKWEWLFIMDDDVILHEKFWKAASTLLKSHPRIGIVWGVNWEVAWRDLHKLMSKNKSKFLAKQIKAFMVRGGLHDSFIRVEALYDIPKIPKYLHRYEDAWIFWSLVCNGWKYAIVREGCFHLNPMTFKQDSLKQIYESTISGYRFGVFNSYTYEELLAAYRNPFKAFLYILLPIVGYFFYLPSYLNKPHLLARRQLFRFIARVALFVGRLKYGLPEHPCKYIKKYQSKLPPA